MTSSPKQTPRPRTSRKGRRGPVKAVLALPPEELAREKARKCYQDVLQRNGSVQEGILAYHRIGQALNDLVPVKHESKYRKNLVGEFIGAWTTLGGFRFGPGQAKYFRVFARAFKDEKLLKRAIKAKLGWTALRELSSAEVDEEDRQGLIERACNLAATEVRAEVRTITESYRKKPRKLLARSARKMPDNVIRRIESLARSLKRLDNAMEHISKIKGFGPQDIVDFCTSVISAGSAAEQCGVRWASRAARAREERDKARLRSAVGGRSMGRRFRAPSIPARQGRTQ